ncbi:MAG: hypothetical protein QOK36_2400 [Gaiellales bacterium]|jgi:hypothetical protein|nr:hypothetical protein [Gaiellales bacterium]
MSLSASCATTESPVERGPAWNASARLADLSRAGRNGDEVPFARVVPIAVGKVSVMIS